MSTTTSRSASSGRSGHDLIESERLSPAEALVELVRGSFLAELVEAVGWQERRLATLAALSNSVPVRRLCYSTGEAELERVGDRLFVELAAL